MECKHNIICICNGLISNKAVVPPIFKCKKCLKIFTFIDTDDDDLREIKVKQ